MRLSSAVTVGPPLVHVHLPVHAQVHPLMRQHMNKAMIRGS